MMHKKIVALGLFGIAAAGLSVPAAAAITTWNLLTGSCVNGGSGDTASRTCTANGVSATATAWANTSNGGGGANTVIDQASLIGFAPGYGVENKDRPGGPGDGLDDTENSGSQGEHAIDNEDRKDSILFSFATPVKLTHLQIGYIRDDSDMTVLAFTGGSCGGTVTGQTYSGLLGCGWTLVNQLSNVSTSGLQSIGNALSISSQYWLIGTYISDVGGTSLSSNNDHVKLIAVKGDTTNGRVPEPATLLLLGAGAAGLWWRRRVA